MNFPLSFSDISLWLAIMAILLLITSELLVASPKYSSRTLVDKQRLRFFATGCGLAFLITVILRIVYPSLA